MHTTPQDSSEKIRMESDEKKNNDVGNKETDDFINQSEEICRDHQTQDKSQNAKNILKEPIISPPITVPYLSPLVLRKELENMLEREGDACLVDYNIGIFNFLLYY